MEKKRKVEIFIAGCPCCDEAVKLVERLAGESFEVEALDMHESGVAQRASEFGVRSVPAVVIDGQLAGCCAGRGVDEDTLRAAGMENRG